MKISRNLVELNDNYDFSEVYCMEKPFGIFMEGFGEGISNAFYMVLKFFQAYQVDGYEYNQINFESMYQVQKDILREFFNTEVVREQINGEEIVSWIEDKIREDCAPFVFVNLKEVFYSKYYKRYDWGHVLLIYGFNSKDRLFYVMDSTQLYKNEHLAIFRPFPITYEIVESAYRASLDVYPSEVCYISCAQKITELKEVICNVIDLGIKNIKDYILKEKIVLKKLMSCEEIDMIDDYAEQLLSIKNAKKVFFKEVLNFVHKIDGKAEIDKITNDIVKGWEKIAIKSV